MGSVASSLSAMARRTVSELTGVYTSVASVPARAGVDLVLVVDIDYASLFVNGDHRQQLHTSALFDAIGPSQREVIRLHALPDATVPNDKGTTYCVYDHYTDDDWLELLATCYKSRMAWVRSTSTNQQLDPLPYYTQTQSFLYPVMFSARSDSWLLNEIDELPSNPSDDGYERGTVVFTRRWLEQVPERVDLRVRERFAKHEEAKRLAMSTVDSFYMRGGRGSSGSRGHESTESKGSSSPAARVFPRT